MGRKTFPLPPSSSWKLPGTRNQYRLIGYGGMESTGQPTAVLLQAYQGVVRRGHSACFAACADEIHVMLQYAWWSDACPPRTDSADRYAVRVGLLLCASNRIVSLVDPVWPRGSDFTSAACSCSNGHCRCDCEVADVELHVELAETLD